MNIFEEAIKENFETLIRVTNKQQEQIDLLTNIFYSQQRINKLLIKLILQFSDGNENKEEIQKIIRKIERLMLND